MAMEAILSQLYVPTIKFNLFTVFLLTIFPNSFVAPMCWEKAARSFSGKKTRRSLRVPLSPRLLPFPLGGVNDCHHVCSHKLSPSKYYAVKIGLLPSPRLWTMPLQLTKVFEALACPSTASCHRTTSPSFSSTEKRKAHPHPIIRIIHTFESLWLATHRRWTNSYQRNKASWAYPHQCWLL